MNNTLESVQCSICLRATSHAVLLKKQTTESSEIISRAHDVYAEHGYYYALFECQGCHNIVLRKALWATDILPDDYDPSYISWHPPIVSRQIPKWHRQLPLDQADLLTQIYQALHAKSYSLVLMGLRAVLDMYIVAKIGDRGTFKGTSINPPVVISAKAEIQSDQRSSV